MSIIGSKRHFLFYILLLVLIPVLPAVAQTDDIGIGSGPTVDTSVQAIGPIITERGKISLSVDGIGMLGSSGIVQVDKPTGATVRRAYLVTASTGLSNYQIPAGGITLDGQPVSWSTTINNSIASWNHWADVTSIVSPIIDAAPAGRINFTVAEADSDDTDGSALAVIFDDPNQISENTIVLLFGAQDVRGDDFSILLADPVDKSDPDLSIEFGVAISFGCQGNCGSQYSQIDVNGSRLTTSAGGYDDGERANGALFTVGGLDDLPANPPDPFRIGGGDSRDDDERYNLLPYVADQSTSILISTLNPSNDDNIFFAYLFLESVTAAVNESVILSPTTGQACFNDGSEHDLTAVAQDSTGAPLANVLVTFEATSGPNQGILGSSITDNNGVATLAYTGTTAGTDIVVARFVNSNNDTVLSNEVTVLWACNVSIETIVLSPATGQACHIDGSEHELTAVARDSNAAPITNTLVTFEAVSGPNQGVLGSDSTDNNGIATLAYSGTTVGTDTVEAYFTNTNNDTIRSNQVTVLWDCVVDPPTPIPEPATMILMGSGIAALGAYVKRRRKQEVG